MKCQCGHARDYHYEEGPTECDVSGCSCKHYQPDPVELAAEIAKADRILSSGGSRLQFSKCADRVEKA